MRVTYREAADADLDAIYHWIADRADPETALQFGDRITSTCERLSYFPRRGTPRDEIMPGLRSIPFEHQATIFYLVGEEEVEIVHIRYRGRDVARAFAGTATIRGHNTN